MDTAGGDASWYPRPVWNRIPHVKPGIARVLERLIRVIFFRPRPRGGRHENDDPRYPRFENRKVSVMDGSVERNGVETIRSDPWAAVFRAVRDFVRRMIGFFTLTDAERTKAGIYIHRRGY
jgi:hypothetical protein